MINFQSLNKLNASSMGFGCVNLSGLYGDPEVAVANIIYAAFEGGVNFFDTADVYGHGQNEELIASACHEYNIQRDQVILATKCGVVWDKKYPSLHGVCNSSSYIKACCEDSLRRLKTDYIDLYYLHRLAKNGEMLEEAMIALSQLVQEGKIRHIGLSEVNVGMIRRAQSIHPLAAIQSEYSLMTRDPEVNGVLQICRELNIEFIAYSPLCRGLLSKEFNLAQLEGNDFRNKLPRFKQGNIENNLLLVNQLDNLAKKHDCTVTQLSLAWVLAQKVIPIPGTKSLKHLKENLEARKIELSQTDLNQLDELFPLGVASGERYSSAILRAYNLTSESNNQ